MMKMESAIKQMIELSADYLREEKELEISLNDCEGDREATLKVLKQIKNYEKKLLELQRVMIYCKAWDENIEYMLKEFGQNNAFFDAVKCDKLDVLKTQPDEHRDDRYCLNAGLYNYFREFCKQVREYEKQEESSKKYLAGLKAKYL